MASVSVPFPQLLPHPRNILQDPVASLERGAGVDEGRHARRRLRLAERRFFQKHFTPIDDTRPEDIFIVGYPKSGNTWFNQMVAGIVYGALASHSTAPYVNDLVPDVHQMPVFKRHRTPMYFKSHHLPRPEYRNVVYLLRDGRDAMVSYWHFQRDVLGNEVDFLRMVRDGQVLFPCKWHDHVRAWTDNPYRARMLTIRYEDLLLDPLVEMQRFCRFSRLEVDRQFLELVVENASFRNARVMARRFAVEDESWSNFIRRGVAGSYRDEMPEEVLRAFLADAGDTLRRLQYPV